MQIRQLNLEDAPALQSLRRIADVDGTLGRPVERQRALTLECIEQQLRPPFETLGYFIGEDMVGSASLSRMPECPIDPEATDWFGLSSVIVHPDFRGRGIGRALLDECISRASKHGAKGMLLVVNVPNPGAVALYESFRFETWSTYEGAYEHNGQRIDQLSMRKWLNVA